MSQKEKVVPPKAPSETKANCPTPCPTPEASAQLESTPDGTNPEQPHARAHEEKGVYLETHYNESVHWHWNGPCCLYFANALNVPKKCCLRSRTSRNEMDS